MGDAKLGLRLLFWGAGARTGVQLVQTAWYRNERHLSRFAFGEHTSDWGLREALDYAVPMILQLASLGATVLMILGAFRLANAARGRGRLFLLAAAGGLAGALALHLPNAAVQFKLIQHNALPARLWGITGQLGLILFTLAMLALLLGMLELAREAKVRPPLAAGIALATLFVWDAVYWMVLVRWLEIRIWDSQWWGLLTVAIDAAQTCLLLVLLDGLASVLDKPAAPAADWGQNASWQLAADGLRSYITALMGRILVPLGLVLLALMGVGMRVLALAATAAIATPFLAVLFSIWMLIGIKRFADFVPTETHARTAAGVAVKLMIAAALLDGIVLIMLLVMFVDHRAIEHAQEMASMSSSAAQMLGVVGIFILLGAFRRVGEFIGVKDATRRVRTAAILIGLSAVLVNQLSLGSPDTARMMRSIGAEFVLVLLLALGIAIAALVVYVGLLKRLRDSIVDGTTAAAVAATPRQSAL